MKTQLKPRRSAGFTLVELLIVIAIILVLAGLVTAGAKAAFDAAAKTSAQNHVTGLKQAIDVFFDDYGQLPSTEETAQRTDDTEDLMKVLVGIDKDINKKGTPFFTAGQAKGGGTSYKDGLVRTSTEAALYDPWGEPYYVVFDTDYDGEIDLPSDFEGTEPVFGVRALVYSYGKDKKPGTRDDVKSW